jgi:glyceraldehyde 3-phosphate dehydrogenase
VVRALQHHPGLELVHVNETAGDLAAAAHLLEFDTVHGRYPGSVAHDDDRLLIDGRPVGFSQVAEPGDIRWDAAGVDLVIEATGKWKTTEAIAPHFDHGARKVVVACPVKSPGVLNVVMGCNDHLYDAATHHVVTAASCTTNCLAPVVKVLLDTCGLDEGLMTTVHAVTATQPTQDGPSKKDWRGGRNAYMNIIPSSTGAAKAVALCLPQVKGKLTGMSFRVPTATVSCVDLTFRPSKPTSIDAIHAAMRAAAEGPMRGVLGFTDEEVVSSDFLGDSRSSIYDSKACLQLSDRFFKVVSWYDNEAGYAARCVDMLQMMAERDGAGRT